MNDSNFVHEDGTDCTADGFVFHPAVIDWAKRTGGFSVRHAGGSYSVPMHEIDRPGCDSKTFAGLIQFDKRWVWFGVRAKANDPILECWAHLVFGGMQTSDPRVRRMKTSIGDVVLDDPQSGSVPKFALNGQGTVLRHWFFSTITGKPAHEPHGGCMDSTRFSPADPTQTGVWDYMGRGGLLGDRSLVEMRSELYALGRYGGQFLHESGRPVLEIDCPGSVLYDGMNFHEKAEPPWIKYTDPRNPWKDHGAHDQYGKRIMVADDQHMSLTNALCEAAIAHPDDEGFRHLLIFSASRYLLQIQGNPSPGGFMNWPGQARSRGRVPMTGFRMAEVFEMLGEWQARKLVLDRALERVVLQVERWHWKVANSQDPIPSWAGNKGTHSPNECGIWYWSLEYALKMAIGQGWPIEKLTAVKEGVAKFCFESFELWGNLQGDRGWGVPYYTGLANGILAGKTASFFAWRAAVSHKCKPDEAEKMAGIRALGDGIEGRFR